MENDGGNHREDRVLLRRMLRRQPSTGTTKKRSVFRVLNACALLLFIAYGLRSDYKVTRSILDEQLIISEQLLPFFDAVNVSLARGEDTQMYTLSKHEQEHVLVPDETTNVVVSLQDDESKHEHEHEHSVGPDIARNGTGTLCFISCIFGAKVKHADSPRDVRELFSNSTNETASFDFFLFTNLKDLPAPGWTKVVKKDLPYKRFITQSRWAKFMGWRDEALSHCGTIIYFDGYLRPVDNLRKFQELASNISKSDSGLVQVRHLGLKRRGIEKLLKRIVKNKKDLPVNVNATLKWLREQPDFHDKITYYLNKYLAYDPSNRQYQKASTFFWDHYSQELDSWRDQPLWSYTMHHFNVTPLVFTHTKNNVIKGGDFFEQNHKGMGFGGHTYSEKSNNDAEKAAAKPR